MLVRAGSRLCPTTLENANEDCPVLSAYSVALTCRVFPGERDHFLFASIAVTSGSEKKIHAWCTETVFCHGRMERGLLKERQRRAASLDYGTVTLRAL